MEIEGSKTLGEFIREAREYHGWNQREFADRVNVKAATISQYENDRRNPPVDVLVKILDELGIDLRLEREDNEWTIEVSPRNTESIRIRPDPGGSPNIFDGLPEDETKDIKALIQTRRERHEDN